jgi:hypothetical protein
VTGRIWLDAIIGFAAAMLVSWLALVIALAIRRPISLTCSDCCDD